MARTLSYRWLMEDSWYDINQWSFSHKRVIVLKYIAWVAKNE
jgi:hypothetical protein